MADFTFLRLDFGDVTVSTGGGAPEVTTSDADRDDSEESSSGSPRSSACSFSRCWPSSRTAGGIRGP